MAAQKRQIQDRRSAARIATRMSCKFTFEGVEHKAFIRDISLTGTFLWQTNMPPKGSSVSIKLEDSLGDSPLTLEGKVVRTDCKNTDRGTVGAFAVRFSNSSPDLIRLITKLSQETRGLKPTKDVSRRFK